MSLEQILAYIVLPLFSSIGTIWLVFSKIILPNYLKNQQDKREFRQSTESEAFKQALIINDKLITVLIDTANNALNNYKMIEAEVKIVREQLERIGTYVEIGNRDRVTLDEVLADIDLMLHEIKGCLK